MANTNTAKLIMQLVDRVTGPARAVVGSLNNVKNATMGLSTMVAAPGRAVAGMGRHIRRTSTDLAGLSAVTAIGVGAATKAVYDYEKAGNKMQAFGLLTDQQRESLEARAQALNKDFPFTNKDILRAAQELFRAGLTYDQAMGALRGSLNLALAGDLDIKEATDIATNVMTAMKLPMETFDQVQASLLQVNDALAFAATNSNTDVRLMGDTFRYVAPLAAAAGMSLHEVTAVSMELAKAGIKGSEAGVALRSALVRMAKPTKPMLAAFERLNINMADFVKYRDDIQSSSIVNSLLPSGIDASAIAGEIQSILDDTTLQGAPMRMGAALTDMIVKSMGDETLRDEISSVVNDAVMSGAQDVDLLRLLKVLREKGATITDISQIFDVRMGSRLAAILSSDLDAAVDRVNNEYYGVGQKMAGQMMQGIIGTTARVIAAFENLVIKIAESGVLDTVAEAMDKIADFATKMAKSNPDLLEFGTYAALALTAIAPLSIAIGGLVTVVGLLINPLSWVVASLGALVWYKWDGLKAGLQAFSFGLKSTVSPEIREGFDYVVNKFWELVGLAQEEPESSKWIAWGRSIGVSVGNAMNDMVKRSNDGAAEIEGYWQMFKSFHGKLQNLGEQIMTTVGEWGAKWAKALNNGLDWLNNDSDAWIQDMIARMAAAMSDGASALYDAGRDAIRRYWEGLKSEALQLVEWARGIAKSIASVFSFDASPTITPQYNNTSVRPGQSNGTLNKIIGNADGAKATGGAVRRGMTYEINERGRETVTMGTNGYVTPAHKVGGGGITNTFHIHGSNGEEIAQKIVTTLDRQLARASQLSLDGRRVR